jgi:hypothetical protein
MIEIVSAQTGEALEHLITLSHEYVNWMIAEIRQRYPELDLQEFTSEHDYDDVRKNFRANIFHPTDICSSRGVKTRCAVALRLVN